MDPETARDYHDRALPKEAHKVAHFCSHVRAEILLDEDHAGRARLREQAQRQRKEDLERATQEARAGMKRYQPNTATWAPSFISKPRR
ncbi:MAG: hypothetical protein R3C58_05240 [Parvularculaceae bacterium]